MPVTVTSMLPAMPMTNKNTLVTQVKKVEAAKGRRIPKSIRLRNVMLNTIRSIISLHTPGNRVLLA